MYFIVESGSFGILLMIFLNLAVYTVYFFLRLYYNICG